LECPEPNALSRDATGAGSIKQPLYIFSILILRVKTPAGADAAQGQSGGQAQHSAANPTQTAAAKKYSFTPSLTLGIKSQSVGVRHSIGQWAESIKVGL